MPTPRKVNGNSKGEGGFQEPYFLKESMALKWNFRRVGGFKLKKPSVGGVWIFSGTTHSDIMFLPCQTKFIKHQINFVFSRIALPQGVMRRFVTWLQSILNDTTSESGSCCCHVNITVWSNWIWFCSAQILFAMFILARLACQTLKFRSADVHKIARQQQCHMLLI